MKRTEQAILKKVNEWKTQPEMVPAVYRLFVFLKWSSIPNEYKDKFDPRAEEIWDNDLESQLENIQVDTEVTIKAILEELSKKHIVAALALVPIILADLFMVGGKPGKLQGDLALLTTEYKNTVEYDRQVAEIEAMLKLEDIITNVVRRMKIKLDFDLGMTMDKLFRDFAKPFETEASPEFIASIEKALDDFEEKAKVDE